MWTAVAAATRLNWLYARCAVKSLLYGMRGDRSPVKMLLCEDDKAAVMIRDNVAGVNQQPC